MKSPKTVAVIFAASAILFALVGIFSRRQPWPPDGKSKQETAQNQETPIQSSPSGEKANAPNPASVYCEENGGSLELVDDSQGQYGICFFDDGSFCEEWEFYRGECKRGQYTIEDLEEATKAAETSEEDYLKPPTCSSCGR